jgi:DNA-binding CsgD family transcriptional regulator
MRKKALSHEEREIQVINWFAIRLQHDNDDYASCYEIAKGLGLSPSTHLRKILTVMEERETLESTKLERSGRWTGRGYRLKRGTFQRPPKQSQGIRLTFGKANNRQLELL